MKLNKNSSPFNSMHFLSIFDLYLKYWTNVILWPSFSATPAQTIFDDAPYKLPFPPKVGPNAGRFKNRRKRDSIEFIQYFTMNSIIKLPSAYAIG